jgi:TMEM175 potassium channel family protein
MINPLRGETSEPDTMRLETFSDAVIAIAITLLVLEIHVPHLEEGSPEDLWRELRTLWPNYLGFLISFITLGVMWANHCAIFKLISRTNHVFTLINLFLLLCIAFIPFPTALMADYLGHPAQQVGLIVYSGVFVVTALAFNMVWFYASNGGRLLDPAADPEAVRSISRRFLLGPPAYLLAFVLAFFNATASLVVLIALTIAYVIPYPGRPQ